MPLTPEGNERRMQYLMFISDISRDKASGIAATDWLVLGTRDKLHRKPGPIFGRRRKSRRSANEAVTICGARSSAGPQILRHASV